MPDGARPIPLILNTTTSIVKELRRNIAPDGRSQAFQLCPEKTKAANRFRSAAVLSRKIYESRTALRIDTLGAIDFRALWPYPDMGCLFHPNFNLTLTT